MDFFEQKERKEKVRRIVLFGEWENWHERGIEKSKNFISAALFVLKRALMVDEKIKEVNNH